MRMRGCAKISSCPEQRMAREVMQEKEVVEVENNDHDQATDDLNNHPFPGWEKLVKVGEATSRQLCRLELANKKLRELEDLLEELEAAKRLEVIAKIEVRKKKAEKRRGFNDVTDLEKLNSDYSIDDALLFIEGQLNRKQKGKNLKKANLKQPEKRKQNMKEKIVKEDIGAETVEERIEPSQSNGKVRVSKTKPKNKFNPKKNLTEKSNSSMFDEIVGDIIDQLGQFELNEESKAKKYLESNFAVEKSEMTENFDVDEEGYWTKVGGITECNKKIKVKKVKTPQLFTVVDVDHENLKTVDIADETISVKLKDSPEVKVNAWMENSQTLQENKKNDLSEADFPSLQSPCQRMLEKKRFSKQRIDFCKEVDLENDKGEVFVDTNLVVWSKDQAQLDLFEEEESGTEVELKVSATTNLEEVNIKNHPIQEEIVDEDQLEEEKVEELGENQNQNQNQNQAEEEVAENQNQKENETEEEKISENQNQEEVVSENQNQAQEEVSENPNEEEGSKKPKQIQMTRMHAMLSGLVVPFGQF